MPVEHDLHEIIENPREAADIEIKSWVDISDKSAQSLIAKEIIALANSGGGTLVIGFKESDSGQFDEDPLRPPNLSGWKQDAIQGVIQRYVRPPFQCKVAHITRTSSGLSYPVISVPGGHRVPVCANRGSPDNNKLVANRIYVRRPGPSSEEPQSPDEWNSLFERCIESRQDDLADIFRKILSGRIPTDSTMEDEAVKSAKKFEKFIEESISRWRKRTDKLPEGSNARLLNGYYYTAFSIEGNYVRPNLSQLDSTIDRAVTNHSGWPAFVMLHRKPYATTAVDGSIEFWKGPDSDGSVDAPQFSDFWRASEDVYLFLLRGYHEDGTTKTEPGESFDLGMIIWRVADAVLQSANIARSIGADEGVIKCRLYLSGLEGRRLRSVFSDRSLSYERICKQESISVEQSFEVDIVPEALNEVVFNLLKPIYALFEFFELPKSVVDGEVRQFLRRG